MILVGNQRGNSADLARHLMSADNERVEVHELRGFVADTLSGAFQESCAISKATRCRQHLFSLSLNPPPGQEVSTADFEAAIGRVERKLGLSNQPRAVVFHDKAGSDGQIRRHCHAVWSRIDAEAMKAVQLSHSKHKLQDVSRDLFIHHGWDMPIGLLCRKERDPLNFTLAQWQQAKRVGKDPRAVKQAFQDAWALSDSKTAFTHALAEKGYHIARGDRRGFVAVDTVTDEVFAIPKWVGVKTRAVRDRLGDEDKLPSLANVRARIASQMIPKMQEFDAELAAKRGRQESRLRAYQTALTQKHAQERRAQDRVQAIRQQREEQERQARFRKGLLGAIDRLTGRHSRIRRENDTAAEHGAERDRLQAARLAQSHDDQQARISALKRQSAKAHEGRKSDLDADAQRFEAHQRAAGQEEEPDRDRYRSKRRAASHSPNLKQAHNEAVTSPSPTDRSAYRQGRQRQSDQHPVRTTSPEHGS